MTFYEAALRVLEESGAPLHSTEITKRAIDKNLLSHVGKTPEITMLSRLAAMARRPRDRKILVTSKDTFALTDWMLNEDAEALAQTGVFEPNPEEKLPPYRPVERHPEPHAEYLRAIGRQADRKRGRDDEGKRRKFPPLPEVAFELLQECQTALIPSELVARLKARDLADEVTASQLIDALADDNQKRIEQGRRPNFAAMRLESGELQLSVEPQREGGPAALELQQAFCTAAGLTFENGRVILRAQQRAAQAQQRAEAATPAGSSAASPEDLALVQTAKHAAKDARKAIARVLRRKLGELDPGTFEKSCIRMLHALHFRELKVSRRSKEGPTLTARRKDGSLELRFAIRLCRGGQAVDRRQVQDLRRDLNNHGANLGLIISAGETRGDARSEAVAGGGLVMLWCGDALAEKFFEAKTGVHVTQVELYDIDDAFFEVAHKDAEEAQKRREERHRERELVRSSDSSAQPTPPMFEVSPAEPAPVALPMTEATVPVAAAGADDAEGDEEGDEEEGPEGSEGEPGATGVAGEPGADGRRRRRRRRRRRGRGAQTGAPGQPGQASGSPVASETSGEAAAPVPPPAVTAPVAPDEASSPPPEGGPAAG